MGGSYSDLYVYFHTKKTDSYSGTGYTVTVTQENFTECSNFVVFTHTIAFTQPFTGRNYNVLLYDGSSNKSKGSRVFGYYYPSNDNEVIQSVSSYYSVLAPNVPLVISFKRGGNIYNCCFGKLKDAGWDRAYNIDRYSFGNILSKDDLVNEFTKLSLNRKIRFKIGSKKVDISGYRQEIQNKMNYRFIFIPKGNESLLGSDYLFAIDFFSNEPITADENPKKRNYCNIGILDRLCQGSSGGCKKTIQDFFAPISNSKIKHKNQIDEYFLHSFNGQLYDGIMVYLVTEDKLYPKTLCTEEEYNKGVALLLEFIDSCKSKTYIKRMDNEGCWWAEEKVNCNNDNELLKKLNEIKSQLKQDVVTVILDTKNEYKGVKEVETNDVGTYAKYIHTFDKASKPNLLFEKNKLEVGPFSKLEMKTNKVEVYYLKAGDKDDTQPFLIVIDENGNTKKKKICHFKDTYNFEEWVDFKFNKKENPNEQLNDEALVQKLDEKVKKIETNGSCIPEISLLRSYAYQILIDPEIGPGPAPPTEDPQRPTEYQPPTTTEPLNIPLIAGCTVGGGVFVISSAVGYGVYWYNTTIKLLT